MAENKSPRTLKPIHLCFDRVLTGPQKVRWAALSKKENRTNTPAPPKRLMGMSIHPAKMALLTGKKWKNGRTLRIAFVDGSATQKRRVREHAEHWRAYESVKFNWTATRAESDIRISFQADDGSWSYIGTENLAIPKNEPTMNFGWLKDDTDDKEYERVVVHEFGHALGCIHEHQNPRGGIRWNEAKVYAYFAGPPNNWSKQDTYSNVIEKYSLNQLNASVFDPASIMLYSFPGELIVGGKGTKANTTLSTGDKRFIAKMYPKS